MIILGYMTSLLYGVLCLALSVLAYKLGMPKQYTRKIVHILVGFEWVILYHFFGAGLHFLAVCLIFTALLAFSYRKKLFTMISSDSDNAPGTVYYGVSMSVMAIISLFADSFVLAFGVAVFCTSFGDGLAGVFGSLIKKHNPKIYRNKSLFGTLSAFAFSLFSTITFSRVYELGLTLGQAVAISALAAGIELISEYGLDNISLPLCTAVLTYLCITDYPVMEYIIPIVATPFIVAFAASAKILTKKGILMALVLDIAVSVSLGNFGFVLLLSFLLLSVLVDKIKNKMRKKDDDITQKNGARDTFQVIANGIIPAIFALLYVIFEHFVFVIAYCTSLAECFADTVASGFGMLSKKAYDPFRMKRVNVGISGGMSLVGTLSSLVFAFAFSTVPLMFGIISFKLCVLCTLCAFIGAVIDSMLGSLLQVKYQCSICKIITEKETHCDNKTNFVSGIKWFTNDVVNLTSCTIASLLAIILFYTIYVKI
ncbi:MAG: DUF92 domain-containing protein [Ruminococcaceae bacterium]|nr:DUF92 domain-containing protein [Oscillospiraceae bacterium]